MGPSDHSNYLEANPALFGGRTSYGADIHDGCSVIIAALHAVSDRHVKMLPWANSRYAIKSSFSASFKHSRV